MKNQGLKLYFNPFFTVEHSENKFDMMNRLVLLLKYHKLSQLDSNSVYLHDFRSMLAL